MKSPQPLNIRLKTLEQQVKEIVRELQLRKENRQPGAVTQLLIAQGSLREAWEIIARP